MRVVTAANRVYDWVMRFWTGIVSGLFAAGLVSGPALADPVTPGPSPQPLFTPAQGGGFTPPKAKEGFRYPDCFCTDSQGKRIEMGQSTCLQIGSQQITARCEMSLNNPTWRRVSDGCPNV